MKNDLTMRTLLSIALFLLAAPGFAQTISLYGGITIPSGSYGSDDQAGAGFAKLGPAASLELTLRAAELVNWTFVAGGSWNSLDDDLYADAMNALTIATGVFHRLEADKDKHYQILTGPELSGALGSDASLFAQALVGVEFFQPGTLSVFAISKESIQLWKIYNDGGNALALGGAVGLRFSRIGVMLRYLQTQEMEIATSSDFPGSLPGKYEQRVSHATLMIGYTF